MRSSQELIDELVEESFKHWYVVIVIGFEDTTTFVTASDDNRLTMLNEALAVGGLPVGLIAADMDTESKKLTMMSLVYPEHSAWHDEAQVYLSKLSQDVAMRLTKGFGKKIGNV